MIAGAQRRTVGEAGEAYIEHLEFVMERKRTTLADYRGYLRRHLSPFFGDRPLDRIDAARVEAFLRAKRGSGLSSKTVGNQLNFLHGVFAFAVKRGWATSNPVALVDRPRTPRHAHRRLRFLQREELDALLRAVPDDELGAVERPLYLCAAMTGLRQGELIGLRWTDVDWVASRVRVAESYTRGAFDSRSPIAAVPCRWRIGWPASSSCTSSARASRPTRTSSSPTRSPATCLTRRSCASASTRRSSAPSCIGSPSTSCATRSAPRWPRPARRCARSRNGWVTPTPARPRSTPLRTGPDARRGVRTEGVR